MNKLTNILIGGLLVILLVAGLVSVLNRPEPKPLGQAISGLSLRLATTSTQQIGQNSVVVLFATTTTVTANDSGADCKSRVITTHADPLLIMFSPGINKGEAGSTTLQNGNYNALIPASTTMAFDSGLYGCDAWIGKGNGASTTVGLSEFR